MYQISALANQLGAALAKKKDQWFLQTLENYRLIESDNLSNFDLYWLRAEMGVKLVENGSKTQIYITNKLIGEWDNNYQFIKNDGTYEVEMNYWN